MLRFLYAQFRFRGMDPYEYLRGGPASEAWYDGHEAVLAAFAENAATQERAMTDLGMALAAGIGG